MRYLGRAGDGEGRAILDLKLQKKMETRTLSDSEPHRDESRNGIAGSAEGHD